MTVLEFEAEKDRLVCRACGAVGLAARRVVNNNGVQVVCPRCSSHRPLGHTHFLRQGRPTVRKPLARRSESLDAIWEAWGGRCAGCGLSVEELIALGLGRHRHHAPPLDDVGECGAVLLPMCKPCHALLTVNKVLLRGLVQGLSDKLGLPSSVTHDPEVRRAIEEDSP